MRSILLVTVVAIINLTLMASTQNTDLPRSTPAREGVEPQAIATFVDSLMAVPLTDIHHVIIVRHGKVIAEAHPAPFERDELHTLFSCSKTFTMLAIGMLVDDGKLSVDDRVVELLPDIAPAVVSEGHKTMTVKHLLTMCAGIKPDVIPSHDTGNWARTWLAQPVTRQGKFQYDSMCTYMLALIVQRISGKTLLDFLNERFFAPLGITDAQWEMCPDGVCVGGWGLRLTAESLAKAGMCMMNKGMWQGRQLISSKWLEEASQAHTNYENPVPYPTDKNQGYCYQMWRCLQPGAFRADGAYGQFIVMLPEQDMVVVINGVSHETDKELATIWNHLVPGVKEEALAFNQAQQDALEEKLQTLSLPLLSDCSRGKWDLGYTFKLAQNVRRYKRITLEYIGPRASQCLMTIEDSDGKVLMFPAKTDGWGYQHSGQLPPYADGDKGVYRESIAGLHGDFITAGNCAWVEKNIFVVRLYWTNWIVSQTLTFHIKGDGTATITNDEGYPGISPETIAATWSQVK